MKAVLLPSRLALERQKWLKAGRVVWQNGLFTWSGRHSLLKALLRQLPPSPRAPLLETAGQLFTRRAAHSLPLFQGIAHSRALPHKLWRLLLQIKASGLHASYLEKQHSPTLKQLGSLLAGYDASLAQAGLEDEADQLARLLAYLADHGLPLGFRRYSGLLVQDSLWLRPMDLRLILGLQPHMDIKLQFALPDLGRRQYLFLLDSTAKVLEESGQVEISWPDAHKHEKSLAGIAYALMAEQPVACANIDIHVASGMYAEVEYLLGQARMQLGSMRPQDILMVFPDLSLYGQMAEDVAVRLNLPLAFRRNRPLTHMPLYLALRRMLTLPQHWWDRDSLIKVLFNPYLLNFFKQICEKLSITLNFGEALEDLNALMIKANYVDSYEQPWPERLRSIADAEESVEKKMYIEKLVIFCQELFNILNFLAEENNLTLYIKNILNDILPFLLPELSQFDKNSHPLDAEQLLARDLQAWQLMHQGLSQLLEASLQAPTISPNLLDIIHAHMNNLNAPEPLQEGIQVLRMEDAMGLRPRLLLAGGLNHGAFPSQPEPFVLSAADRNRLSRQAGMPVWRSEDEEYHGQQLRLNLLLANTQERAVFSCALAPAMWLKNLADLCGQQIEKLCQSGATFGQVPDLAVAKDREELDLALIYNIYGPGKQKQLAQAVLARLGEDMEEPLPWPPARPFAGAGLVMLKEQLGRFKQLPATALDSYLYCPRQWFFNYLAGLGKEEAPSWELDYRHDGMVVHHLLAEFFKHHPAAFEPQAVSQRLEQIWHSMQLPKHSFIMAARRPTFMEQAFKVIKYEYQHMEGYAPMQVEYEVRLSSHPDMPAIVGRIDRLDVGAAGWRVTDYKNSGSITPGDYTFDDKGQIKKIQLMLYLAALSGQGNKALQGRIVSGKRPDLSALAIEFAANDPFLTKGHDHDNIHSRIYQLWQNISQGNFSPVDDKNKCPSCPYLHLCQAGQEIYG